MKLAKTSKLCYNLLNNNKNKNMSNFTKRKLAFIFVLSAFVVTMATVGFILSKIDIAQAAPVNPCVPLSGKTTIVKNNPEGVSNSGLIDFDSMVSMKDTTIGGKIYTSGVVIGDGQRACVQKELDVNGNETGNFVVKGWAWDDNIGMISFYCHNGENFGWTCGGEYAAVIGADGMFKTGTKIYSSMIGEINVGGGTTPDATSAYPLNPPYYKASGTLNDMTGASAFNRIFRNVATGAITTTVNRRMGWSDRVGWFDFMGVTIPINLVASHDLDMDGFCAIGDSTCPGDKNPGDCNDNDASVHPGATDIIVGGKCVDKNCDGKLSCEMENGGPSGNPVSDCSGQPDGTLCTNNQKGVCTRTGVCVNGTCNAPTITPGTELCATGYNEDCDDDTDETPPPAKCCVQGSPACKFPEYRCSIKQEAYISGNSPSNGEAVISDAESANKEMIMKNVEKLKNYAMGAFGSVSSLSNDDTDVVFVSSDIALNEDFGFASWNKSKTIAVVGGDIYINSDFYNESDETPDRQLGIIALKDYGAGGNVYISKNVKNLQVQIFAEGGIYSYDPDTNSKMENPGIETWRQLFVEGTMSSNDNTFETTPYYQDNNLLCLRSAKVNTSDNGILEVDADRQAKGGETSTQSTLLIIYKSPLKDLPVFNGIISSGSNQNN